MSNKNASPIPVNNEAVSTRIRQMVEQRAQIELLLNHTVRTVADMLGVPDTYQFDPQTGSFVPVQTQEAKRLRNGSCRGHGVQYRALAG